jgi:ABC-type nitrate/sulfonate/bicarbonate transport system ATPase subunit
VLIITLCFITFRHYRNARSSSATVRSYFTHDVEEAIFLSERIFVIASQSGRLEISIQLSGDRNNLDAKLSSKGINRDIQVPRDEAHPSQQQSLMLR